jgi:hypothetical protein
VDKADDNILIGASGAWLENGVTPRYTCSLLVLRVQALRVSGTYHFESRSNAEDLPIIKETLHRLRPGI